MLAFDSMTPPIKGGVIAFPEPKVALGTSVPDTDDTPAIVPRHRWELGDDRAKMLPSTNPELEDDVTQTQGASWFLISVHCCFSFRGSEWIRREKAQSG
jgi:hypothetical protein